MKQPSKKRRRNDDRVFTWLPSEDQQGAALSISIGGLPATALWLRFPKRGRQGADWIIKSETYKRVLTSVVQGDFPDTFLSMEDQAEITSHWATARGCTI